MRISEFGFRGLRFLYTFEFDSIILEAFFRNQEKFRVYITIPLLPGFEGDIGANYSALLAVLHWTMLSISKGPHSLIENLMMNGVSDPWDYISFTSLRNWDELCGKLVRLFEFLSSNLFNGCMSRKI